MKNKRALAIDRRAKFCASSENPSVTNHLGGFCRDLEDNQASTAAREKAVTTRLILCTLSGLISGFAAICATMIYSTALEWRYFWLAVCVAGFVALCVFLWQACERFYGTEEGSGPV